jgi:hypothetical protein
MKIDTQTILTPGPDTDHPLTLIIRRAELNEDRERAQIEMDLTLEYAEKLAKDLLMVVRWVRNGTWGPTPKIPA